MTKLLIVEDDKEFIQSLRIALREKFNFVEVVPQDREKIWKSMTDPNSKNLLGLSKKMLHSGDILVIDLDSVEAGRPKEGLNLVLKIWSEWKVMKPVVSRKRRRMPRVYSGRNSTIMRWTRCPEHDDSLLHTSVL